MEINITGRTESYHILTPKYEINLMHIKYFNPGISDYEIVTIKDKNGKKVVVDDEERAELEERILEKIAKLEDEGKFR